MKKSVEELKGKTVHELLVMGEKLRAELAKLTLQTKASPPKDSNTLSKKKRELAVLLTVITLKKKATV